MNRLINGISGNISPRLARASIVLGSLLAILAVSAPLAQAQDGPVIDVWYGLNQQFGIPGEPQIWCDIHGNVSDPDGVAALSYILNAGSPVNLTIGTDGRRLISPGDFIVDLLVDDLQAGPNSIVITAEDGLGNLSTETVTLTYSPGNSWPTDYATDWGSLAVDGDPLTPDPAILEQAHVVDGKWTVVGDSIRTVEPGYDRLIGIGELGWGDYEVTVPITIHNILDVNQFGVGLIFRWNGHTNDPDYCVQPLCGWKPLGDIGWLKNGRLNLWDKDKNAAMTVDTDTVYWLKMRVETDTGGAQYSLKAWEDGGIEPPWMITDTKPANSPMAGSLLLVAHESEVSFGNVTVVDITGPNVDPVANDVAANAKFNGTSFIDVTFNDTDSDGVIIPGTVAIGTPPTEGTIVGIDPVSGIVEYLHGGGANPTDTFTYTVEDNDGAQSNVATVTLTIVPNVPPTANDDAAFVKVAESVDIDVPANDTDGDGTLDLGTVVITGSPLHGTVSAVNPSTGVVTYDQDLTVAAADSFTYTINDNDGATSNEATVVLTITPNVPPTAVDDDAFVAFNAATDIDVAANDTDSDGTIDPTTVTIIDGAFDGSTFVDPVTGVVTYTHTALAAAPDSFTYTVEDDTGDLSNIAMVRIDVGPEPPEDFFSDDFNSCDVDPMWTFVDPQGDAPEPVIVGAFSGDAQVAISVPGGSTHQPYDDYLGAPYLIQACQDKDFTLETKFSSTLPDSAYALQGVLVRQDDSTWMRFDFYSNNSSEIKIYGSTNIQDDKFADTAIAIPGDSPLYLRVTRTGDNWDLYYSTDGVTWPLAGSKSYAMTVSGVGLFAGNAGGTGAPPFTTFVDYFSNSLDPVVEPDDQDLNSVYVSVSGLGSVSKSPDQAVYACGDPVQLTASPDPDWVFTGWSGDLGGTDNPASLTMDRPRHVTANFAPTSGTVIVANTSVVPGISTGQPCASGVPIEVLRDGGTDIRGFTVTFGLTGLALCDGENSIIEGDYLSSVSATSGTQIIDNLDGTWDVDVAILGTPCGATALTGTLFTLDVTNTIADGAGIIDIIDVQLRDCSNNPIAAAAGGPAEIPINTTAPAGVTDLAFSKVMSDNPAGNVTAVDITWTPSVDPNVTSVSVYRKGFGSYPEYDDGGGAAPALPVDPVAEGWELVAVVPVGTNTATDLAGSRDYWYFCAVASDALDNRSAAVMTTGVLNYLLGDVSDGGIPILDGDNKVLTDDLTLLGAHYGTGDGDALYLANLDIGPTSDMSVDGLPATDDVIEFEDLMLFGINYGTDVGPLSQAPAGNSVPDPAPENLLALHLPDIPAVGQTFSASLVLAGDGQIQGLKIPLVWDASVVAPVSIQGGQLLTDQGGSSLVLSATPGVVDICLAGVRPSGISGVGQVAAVTFQVLDVGSTLLEIGEVDARDSDNNPVFVAVTAATPVGDGGTLPTVSTLHANYPNPFNPMTTIAFDLAVSGRVRIDIFSIDGRRIRTLVDAAYVPGRHSEVWNGRDQSGRTVASGTYLYTMQGPGIKQTRRMLLIK